MEPVFQRAQLSDVPTLIRVQNEAFVADYRRYGQCPAYNETSEAMSRQVNTRIVLKIMLGDEVVGDIIVRREAPDRAYLRVLAVLPEQQGRGLGSKSLQYLDTLLPEIREWTLETPADKAENARFYERHGYVVTSTTRESPQLVLAHYRRLRAPQGSV